MGSSTIYWSPDPTGPLRRITFDRGCSKLVFDPDPQVKDVYSGDQFPYRNYMGMRRKVQIIVEKYKGGVQTLEQDFFDLQAHLAAGRTIGFSADHEKTYCARLSSVPTSRSTVLHHSGGNAFSAWSSGVTPAVDDEYVIEGDYASGFRSEVTTIAIYAASQTTIGRDVKYAYASLPIFRYRWFWPVLRQPENAVKANIDTEQRQFYRLFLDLQYLPTMAFALFDGYGRRGDSGTRLALRGTTATNVMGQQSVEQILATSASPNFDVQGT